MGLVERRGQSAQLHQEAGGFGVQHTFTIRENGLDGDNYYHFATHLPDQSINQVYISNIDLLKLFIMNFKEKINQSKQLKSAYDVRYSLDENAHGYLISPKGINMNQSVLRQSFMQEIELNQKIKISNGKSLSLREIEILTWLHDGKTVHDIAKIIGVAEITVSKHIAKIKEKVQCYTQFQLGEFFARLFEQPKEIIDQIRK